MITSNLPDHTVVAAHVISLGAILGSFAGILPPLAALGAFVWYCIQIYESKSFQNWLAKMRGKPNAAPEPDQPDA